MSPTYLSQIRNLIAVYGVRNTDPHKFLRAVQELEEGPLSFECRQCLVSHLSIVDYRVVIEIFDHIDRVARGV